MKKPKHPGSVGYGRPPVHSRFKPGQSGNPKGRPGGKRRANYRKSLGSPMWKILREKLTLREGERTITMSKLEAALHNYVAEALKGETRAIVALMELAHYYREFAPEPQKPGSLRVVIVDDDGNETEMAPDG